MAGLSTLGLPVTRHRHPTPPRKPSPEGPIQSHLGSNHYSLAGDFGCATPPTDDIVFRDEVSIDLMFINGKAILHIVDTATRFSVAILFTQI
jgi:hypothetical protein